MEDRQIMPTFWREKGDLELVIDQMESLRPQVIDASKVTIDGKRKSRIFQDEWHLFLIKIEGLFTKEDKFRFGSFLRLYLSSDDIIEVFRRVDDQKMKQRVVGIMAVVLFLIGFDIPVPKEMWDFIKEKTADTEIDLFIFHNSKNANRNNKKGGDVMRKFIELDKKQQGVAAALMAYAGRIDKGRRVPAKVEDYTIYEWAGKVDSEMVVFIIDYLRNKPVEIIVDENEVRLILGQLEKVPNFIIKDTDGTLWVNTQKELSRAVIVEGNLGKDEVESQEIGRIAKRRGRSPVVREKIFPLLRQFFIQSSNFQKGVHIEHNGQIFYLLGKWGDFKDELLRFLIDQGVRTSLTMTYQYLWKFLPVAGDLIINEGRKYFVAKIDEHSYQQKEKVEASEVPEEAVQPEANREKLGEEGNLPINAGVSGDGEDNRISAIAALIQSPEEEFLKGLAQLTSVAAARLLEIEGGKELAKELSGLFARIVDLNSRRGEAVNG